eukprot:3711315-Rhodomonas_salina.1
MLVAAYSRLVPQTSYCAGSTTAFVLRARLRTALCQYQIIVYCVGRQLPGSPSLPAILYCAAGPYGLSVPARLYWVPGELVQVGHVVHEVDDVVAVDAGSSVLNLSTGLRVADGSSIPYLSTAHHIANT